MFGGAVHYIIYAQGWSLAFSCDVGMSLQRTEETFVASFAQAAKIVAMTMVIFIMFC